MRKFGFSTGALAKSDVKKALDLSARYHANAVEYSALRFNEVEPMVNFLYRHGVGKYDYAAFHAPSSFAAEDETTLVMLLRDLVKKWSINVVIHPDSIHDFALWRQLGDKLCIENMDHRKRIGRTADELSDIFKKLPRARLCFDIGHAHEIDRSLSNAYEILRRYRNRIMHVHMSEVSDEGEHRGFSASSKSSFAKLLDLIPNDAAVILETVTPDENVGEQLNEAKTMFLAVSGKKINAYRRRRKKR
jgi:hypothetical protein